MTSKNRKHLARALGICTVLVLAGTVVQFQRQSRLHKDTVITVPQVAASTAQPTTINRGLPAKLVIAKLNISAKVTYMGLTKSGDMEVPNNVHDTGWYKYGALPGNKGSAVIAGHLDGKNGEAGVFTALDTLQKGDIISVVDTKDQNTNFTVRETRTYQQNEKPAEVFAAHEGAQLNLITCTGAWNKDQQQFAQRLVVFADIAR